VRQAQQAQQAQQAPLSQRALYLDVAERLRQQIYEGDLPPGAWVDEQVLCTRYGISRTPLREALKVLAAEGLVTMKLRRGAYVTEVSADEVAQVYHLLALLESDAARTVASHGTPQALAALQRLHDELESQVGHRDAFFAANEAFHVAMVQAAGNRYAVQLVGDLRKLMKLNRHHSLLQQGRLADSLAEHRSLMQALQNKRPEKAAQLMQRHFVNGLKAAL
jgi:DNA-binding GntR family transcriptional regulator